MVGRGRPKGPTPGLRSRWLGEKLRALREAAGKSRSDAAEFLQRDPTAVSRHETGEYPIRRADVYALLTFYGVDDEKKRDALLTLCEDVWRKSWWDPYSEDVNLSSDFINLPWLESRAEEIDSYGNMLIQGLLQTPAFAEVVIRHAANDTPEEHIQRWVDLRLERQKVLRGASPVRHVTVMEEFALRRPIGGPKVMREQLEHLLELGQQDNIEIRIMPITHGPHSGHLGSFSLFSMPEELPSVAHVETLGGVLYIESPGVELFEDAWDDLYESALDAEKSAALIETIMKETT